MKIGRLNHVGVATPDVEAAARVYADLYGAADATPAKAFPKLGVKVVFVNLPNMQIELLEPLSADSPVTKFLEKNPKGGQHHMCFEVPDIVAAASRPGALRTLRRSPWGRARRSASIRCAS